MPVLRALSLLLRALKVNLFFVQELCASLCQDAELSMHWFYSKILFARSALCLQREIAQWTASDLFGQEADRRISADGQALEPAIAEQIMTTHHQKHHQTYAGLCSERSLPNIPN